MKNPAPVGLIGLGLMGEVFARRLLAAGFAVCGFDIDPAKRKKLGDLGGRAARDVAEIARTCDPIVVIVFNTEQVEDVVEALLAFLGNSSGKTVMCASTCDPDRIAALGARVTPLGLRFLETPVSGASAQVARGEGVGLIGGDAELAAKFASVLDALYPKRFHVGAVGDGGRSKLATNLILGLNRVALAEGLVFAERIGLDLAAFAKVVRESAAYSQVMDVKVDKMVLGDFAPQAYARQTLKDAHLMIELANRVGQQLPLLSVHADVLEACVRHGEGDHDNSVVIEEIRRRRKPAAKASEKPPARRRSRG